jgi:hypothetical protein
VRSIKYVPEACKGESPKFSGEVELRVPSYDEKLEMFELSGMEFNSNGKVELSSTSCNIKILRAMIKHSEKFYQSVSLKKLSSGQELKSFEDLQYDSDGPSVLIEIASSLGKGFDLGNE